MFFSHMTDILRLLMDTNHTQKDIETSQSIKDIQGDIESKVQKVITALYLISDLIDEKDPIRKTIRNLSVELSTLVGSLAIESPSRAKKMLTEAQSVIDRIQGLLKVSVNIGFMSDMNFKIMSDTLALVRDDLNKKYQILNSQSLVASSFHNKAIHEFVLPDFIMKNQESVKKQTVDNTRVFSQIKQKIVKDDREVVKDKLGSERELDDRTQKVLTIVAQKQEVSVSDVSIEFPELSEKTMQRILVRLVEKGKLVKTGEKRWSRYSIPK